jgi:signal transduction histidine kinase
MESLFEELKRYVEWSAADEAALRSLHPKAAPELERISVVFYDRILTHSEARKALEGGESQVGRLKITLVAWMDSLLSGPWDEDYYERRARIGRVHVRIALPQHYMFGAMSVLRSELVQVIDRHYRGEPDEERAVRNALGKILDLELAIMLHTYREDLEAQNARSERLATFGQLIGSIGHELRNPLGVMESSLYILDQRVGSDEKAAKHIGRLNEQVHIANAIVSSLLDMIRDRPLACEPIQVAAVIQSVLSSVKVEAGVSVVVDGLDDLPVLNGDSAQVRQLFFNLLQNALQAVDGNGEVQVSGRVVGGGVEIVVEDSGPGVDPETRRRLFEPLITTKLNGIGLGLALVKRIAERHGGAVRYEPGDRGARFVVTLRGGNHHA